MTDDQLLSVFDGGDPEPALLKLAAVCPSFGKNDLLLALRQLRDMPDRGDSLREAMKLFQGASLGSWGAFSVALGTGFGDIFSSKKDNAFRTIFRVMFETAAWDDEILFQPGFFDEVVTIRDALRRATGNTGYHDRRKLDMYEVFAEMADKLADKIRLHSGV